MSVVVAEAISAPFAMFTAAEWVLIPVIVSVLAVVITVTHSTAIFPADTRVIDVSEACPSSMLHVVVEFVVQFEIVPVKVTFPFFSIVIASLFDHAAVPLPTTRSLSVAT